MKCRSGIGFVLVLGATACSTSEAASKAAAGEPVHVLTELPPDLQERRRIDYEGKLALVGYDQFPVGQITPGSALTVRLYWQRLAPLEPGWNLFTQVVDAYGKRRGQGDAGGAGKPPHEWRLGDIHVQELVFDIPSDMPSEATLLAGVWRPGYTLAANPGVRTADLRLQIISGSDYGENRAIVAHIATGKKPSPRWHGRRRARGPHH